MLPPFSGGLHCGNDKAKTVMDRHAYYAPAESTAGSIGLEQVRHRATDRLVVLPPFSGGSIAARR